MVSINARVECNKELKEGERVIRRERYSGAISRSFAPGSELDEATASAQYQDGVLSLTLPKKAPSEQNVCRSTDRLMKGAERVAH
jgi:HSP20 family protein